MTAEERAIEIVNKLVAEDFIAFGPEQRDPWLVIIESALAHAAEVKERCAKVAQERDCSCSRLPLIRDFEEKHICLLACPLTIAAAIRALEVE